jgi:transposase-like protein
MSDILAGILTLIQYKNDIEDNFKEEYRPERCEHCGKQNVWCHGDYPRKAAGRRNQSDVALNPIKISRYYCASCRRTMSVLPECLPPHRWYLWSVQQTILLLILSGESIYKIAKTSAPSRHTIARWMMRFKEQFLIHRDVLGCIKHNLSQYVTFNLFWGACFNVMGLGEVMRLCHLSGVVIP